MQLPENCDRENPVKVADRMNFLEQAGDKKDIRTDARDKGASYVPWEYLTNFTWTTGDEALSG